MKAEAAICKELMGIRFTPPRPSTACAASCATSSTTLRRHEREVRRIVVDRCGMDQSASSWPSSANMPLDAGWAQRHAAAGKRYSAALGRHIPPAIHELQAAMAQLQARVLVPTAVLKKIGQQMNDGDKDARTPWPRWSRPTCASLSRSRRST
jgi:RNA polymerase primary sigma factor